MKLGAALIMGAAIRPRPFGVKILKLFPDFGRLLHTARHSHSAICAITSPNSNSAADQTSAETKFAI
jgi:hypothetical protein